MSSVPPDAATGPPTNVARDPNTIYALPPEVRAAVWFAARTAAPIFNLFGWTYYDDGRPDEATLTATIAHLVKDVLDNPAALSAATGRFRVHRHRGEEGEPDDDIAIHLELDRVSVPAAESPFAAALRGPEAGTVKWSSRYCHMCGQLIPEAGVTVTRNVLRDAEVSAEVRKLLAKSFPGDAVHAMAGAYAAVEAFHASRLAALRGSAIPDEQGTAPTPETLPEAVTKAELARLLNMCLEGREADARVREISEKYGLGTAPAGEPSEVAIDAFRDECMRRGVGTRDDARACLRVAYAIDGGTSHEK